MIGSPLVADTWLLDWNATSTRHDLSLGKMAISDDLATAITIPDVVVAADEGGHLVLERTDQHLTGSLVENLVKHTSGLARSLRPWYIRSYVHGVSSLPLWGSRSLNNREDTPPFVQVLEHNFRLYLTRGRTEADSELMWDALEHVDQAIRLSKHPRCLYHVQRARVAYSLKDSGTSYSCIAALKEHFEGDPYAWYAIGLAMFADDQKEERMASYKRAVLLRGSLIVALNNLGFELRLLGRYKEALRYLRDCLDNNRCFALAWANMAFIHLRQKNPDEALKCCDKGWDCARTDRSKSFIMRCRGRAHHALGNYQEALEDYEAALSLSFRGEDGYIWANKGQTLVALEEFEEALSAFVKAIKFNPHFSTAYLNKARCLVKLARAKEARATILKEREIAATVPSALNEAAWFFVAPECDGGTPSNWTAGDFTKALGWAQEAVKLTKRPNAGYLDTLAWAYYRNGDAKAAVATENEAIALLENQPSADEARIKSFRKTCAKFTAALKQQQ